MRDYHKISLQDVAVDLRVGIHGWERTGKKQKIVVDLDLYRYRGKFTGKSIKDCVDYDRPFHFITKEWSRRTHTDLLETLAEELIAFCMKDKTIDAVRVVVRKPNVFKGKAKPAVEFFRTRGKK